MISPTAKKWIFRLIKFTILALVVWGCYRTVNEAYWQAQQESFDFRDLDAGWLFFAGAIYMVGQIPSAYFYYGVLKQLDQKPRFYQTMRAHFIGHLGKYMPGKALVVVLRTNLTIRPGVGIGPTVAAVFYETLSLVAVGAILAAAVLLTTVERDWTKAWELIKNFSLRSKGTAGSDPKLLLLAIIVAGATFIPTIPFMFRWLLRHLKKFKLKTKSEKNPDVEQTTVVDLEAEASPKEFHISTGFLVQGWIGFIIGWFLMGISLWAVVRSLPDQSHVSLAENILIMTASASLAIGAGFVSLIPGGLGVREFVFIMMLGPIFSSDILGSVITPAILRVLWLIAEAVVAGVLWVIPPRDTR